MRLQMELMQLLLLGVNSSNSKDSHARTIAEAVSRDRAAKRRKWFTSPRKKHRRGVAVPPTRPRWMKMRRKCSPRPREGSGGGEIWRRKMEMKPGMRPSRPAAEHKVVVKDRVGGTMMSSWMTMLTEMRPDLRPLGDRRVNVVASRRPRIDHRLPGEARARNRAKRPRERPTCRRRERR